MRRTTITLTTAVDVDALISTMVRAVAIRATAMMQVTCQVPRQRIAATNATRPEVCRKPIVTHSSFHTPTSR